MRELLRNRWEKHADRFRALAENPSVPPSEPDASKQIFCTSEVFFRHCETLVSPSHSERFCETLQLAPAYHSVTVTENLQNARRLTDSRIVKPSTPDAPVHIHPLCCFPFSTRSPHPHVGSFPDSEIAGRNTPDAPMHLHPLHLSPLSPLSPRPHTDFLSRSSIGRSTTPDAPTHFHPSDRSPTALPKPREKFGEDLPKLRSLVPYGARSRHTNMQSAPQPELSPPCSSRCRAPKTNLKSVSEDSNRCIPRPRKGMRRFLCLVGHDILD